MEKVQNDLVGQLRSQRSADESNDFAQWNITTSAPNWTVATRYDFLRYEDVLNANLSEPLYRQIPRALHWLIDDLVSGATYRIIRAAWRFWIHLFGLQLGLLIWLALAVIAGWLGGRIALAVFPGAPWLGLLAGVAVAIGCFYALRPIAERTFIIRVNNCWPYLREFGRGAAPCFDRPIEAAAGRLVEAVAANDVDEIVVVAHSAGGPLAPAILEKALSLDPELGRVVHPLSC